MIHAIIRFRGQVRLLDLPMNPYLMSRELEAIGIDVPAEDILLMDDENAVIGVKLYHESDVSRKLIILLRPEHTLGDTNAICFLLNNLASEPTKQIVDQLLSDQYADMETLADSLRQAARSEPLQVMKLYCPLKIKREQETWEDEFGYEDYVEVDPSDDRLSVGRIRGFFHAMLDARKEPRGLMAYYHGEDSAADKVYSLFPDVEVRDGQLWGVFEMRTTGQLTDAELESVRDYTVGQASDGIGESAEQRPISMGELGAIYISIWHSGNDYFMKTEEEFEKYLTDQQPGIILICN